MYPGVPGTPTAPPPRAVDTLAQLRGGLSASAPADWVEQLRSGLRQLRDELREHIAATEGPNGLYDEVRRSDPRLACAVTRLRREHGKLSDTVDELSAWASEAEEDPSRLNAVRPRIRALLKQWGSHRRRDTQLAYDAVSLDLGGQD
ncbi:hemerythrin domain-containing protein [Yinghuangia seranimata]|uniref:hemerythrin domain-containing protein n=1 Tax=Yinghuangia seranimata TaxID=408067 RepID=UPI00248C84A1|nr:hemerythrin domain-containing protein [Yinghuangia seranimata]MDI2128673.1 hemerythrin domain-containing protein [Yinghuangia seranimata]